MKEKRGQAVIFVILGIAIIAIGIIIALLSSGNKTGSITDQKIAPIQNKVTDCLKTVGSDGIIYAGERGGFFENSPKMSDSGISYYLYNGKNYMPSKNELEKQIGEYVNDLILSCTRGFVEFHPEFEVEEKAPVTKVAITENVVKFEMSYPLVITGDDKNYNLENFEASVDARVGTIYNAMYELMEEQMTDTSGVCIFCVYDIANENDLLINSYDYDHKEILFIIEDTNTLLNGESLLFTFINKYD